MYRSFITELAIHAILIVWMEQIHVRTTVKVRGEQLRYFNFPFIYVTFIQLRPGSSPSLWFKTCLCSVRVDIL